MRVVVCGCVNVGLMVCCRLVVASLLDTWDGVKGGFWFLRVTEQEATFVQILLGVSHYSGNRSGLPKGGP